MSATGDSSGRSLAAAAASEFERRLHSAFGDQVLSVRIFGSFARGTAHEESDLDLFVLLREAPFGRRREVLNIAGDVWLETGLLVSPTVFDDATYQTHLRQERPLAIEIQRTSIAV